MLARLRRHGLPALAVGVAVLGVAPAAHAAVTRTAVTSPSGHLTEDRDLPSAPEVQVTGTSDGTAGDKVDLIYTAGGDVRVIASDFPYGTNVLPSLTVDAGGTWSTPAPGTPGALEVSELFGGASPRYPYAGTLHAVPAGTNPTNLGPFTGSRIFLSRQQRYAYSSGPNLGKLTDFYLSAPQAKGFFDYYSLSSCGIADSVPFFGPNLTGGQTFHYLNFCNAYPFRNGDGVTPGLRVDGHPAYDAYGASATNSDAPGAPTPTFSYGQDPLTGNATITESQPIVRCARLDGTAVDRVNPGTDCEQYLPTGLRIDRRIVQDLEGLRSTVTDTLVSADGAAHTVDLFYENDYDSDDSVYRLPTDASFNAYQLFDASASFPSAVGSIQIQADPSEGDGHPDNPQGALTYSTAPSRIDFYGQDGFFLSFNGRQVPAGGSTTITQVYTQARTSAEATALRLGAEDALTVPAVSITSPAAGSVTTQPTATVTGTATDVQIASVTVNGVAATLSGGAFSAAVPLTPGLNTLTAVATDGAGLTGQAQVQVLFTPPVPPVARPAATCTVPRISRGSTLTSTRRKITRAGCVPGRVTQVRSRTKKGRVVSISRRAGTRVAVGTRISIRVSRGMPAKKRQSRSADSVERGGRGFRVLNG